MLPSFAANATDNSATFGYGTYNDPGNQASKIDILFTVTVNDQPFADGLFLTNQVSDRRLNQRSPALGQFDHSTPADRAGLVH